jgi:hypothetical protein
MARLGPGAPVFAKARGRPTNFDVQDLMFEMFEVFEGVYKRPIYEGKEEAVTVFDWLLAKLDLGEIRPNYWMRRLEQYRRAERREFDAAFANCEGWLTSTLHE